MEIKLERIEYKFEPCDAQTTGLMVSIICKGLGYKALNKERLKNIFDLSQEAIENKANSRQIIKQVQLKVDEKKEFLNKACEQLQKKWDECKYEFLKGVGEGLQIQFIDEEVYKASCYLQLVPINQIDISNSSIYLDCNKSVEEMFNCFLITVVKSFLVDRWYQFNGKGFTLDYESENRLWLFVEIAVDAIFSNSSLINFCKYPSYKYFYSLKINNTNFMNEFRKLYKLVPLKNFFDAVHHFAYQNYEKLATFKHYLY